MMLSESLSQSIQQAAWTDQVRMASRLLPKWNWRVSVELSVLAREIHTVPTGLSLVPPLGPAIPVIARVWVGVDESLKSCRARVSAPWAIDWAAAALTAPGELG